jgi:uncharacterized membrane-anchored protein
MRRIQKQGLLLLAVAIVQIALLANMVHSRVSVLKNGQEILIETGNFDPRDLFRGDYVWFNHQLARLRLKELEGDDEFTGNVVWVVLKPDAAGVSRPVAVHQNRPVETAGMTIIKGRARGLRRPTDQLHHVRYGIETYFVPEGTGRELERASRKDFFIIVAVAPSGEAAIKGLKRGGKVIYEEPLF